MPYVLHVCFLKDCKVIIKQAKSHDVLILILETLGNTTSLHRKNIGKYCEYKSWAISLL